MKFPEVRPVREDDTHRLIPARYVDGDRSVLSRLTRSERELEEAFTLDGATNDRLVAEANGLPGISLLELVFGVPYAHIVNAAFTHPNPNGTRFAGADRGVWYAALRKSTCVKEVAYHKVKELDELPTWDEAETIDFVDFLADFRTDLHDLRNGDEKAAYLDPNDYGPSQALAQGLLEAGSGGVVYPSVRDAGGTCIACFRPTLVVNVRRGKGERITFATKGTVPRYRVG